MFRKETELSVWLLVNCPFSPLHKSVRVNVMNFISYPYTLHNYQIISYRQFCIHSSTDKEECVKYFVVTYLIESRELPNLLQVK
jgi:hypothetical protein